VVFISLFLSPVYIPEIQMTFLKFTVIISLRIERG